MSTCNEPECLRWDNSKNITRLEVEGTNIQVMVVPLNGEPFAGYIIDKRNDQHIHFPANDILILLGWLEVKSET